MFSREQSILANQITATGWSYREQIFNLILLSDHSDNFCKNNQKIVIDYRFNRCFSFVETNYILSHDSFFFCILYCNIGLPSALRYKANCCISSVAEAKALVIISTQLPCLLSFLPRAELYHRLIQKRSH